MMPVCYPQSCSPEDFISPLPLALYLCLAVPGVALQSHSLVFLNSVFSKYHISILPHGLLPSALLCVPIIHIIQWVLFSISLEISIAPQSIRARHDKANIMDITTTYEGPEITTIAQKCSAKPMEWINKPDLKSGIPGKQMCMGVHGSNQI